MDFLEVVVNNAREYESAYRYLREVGYSKNYLSALRQNPDYFLINGEKRPLKTVVKNGDALKLKANPTQSVGIMPNIIPLDIVFEDDFYLIVNKPSGLSCMPSRSHYHSNLGGGILNHLSKTQPSPTLRILGRLDKDTAGIIIAAKNAPAAKLEFSKTYHAIVCGKITKPLTINKPIKTVSVNGINNQKRVIDTSGLPATTHVTPLKVFKNHTLIQLNLEHGRTHQIRVHLSSQGHPLLGDRLYGVDTLLLNHAALVCKKCSFTHPFTREKTEFEIDYPHDFSDILKEL